MTTIAISEKYDAKFRNLCFDEFAYYYSKIFDTEITLTDDMNTANIVILGQLKSYNNDPLMSCNDAIDIHIDRGCGSIAGNSQVATLIALYRYFHELGTRFLRPGRDNEVVPHLGSQALDKVKVDIHERASYKHRGVCIEGADSLEIISDFISWLPKVGFNTFFIQFENPYPFLKRWYEHEYNPYIPKEEFSEDIASRMSKTIDELMQVRGIVHHRVGHGWTGEVLGYSSKFGWESGVTLPEEKKPLVALRNGKRELYDGAPILTSLDFANPEVIDRMVDVVVDYATRRRDVDYLHVWLSDARNNICECDDCKKTTVSDQYVEFLNKLDEKLTQQGLETKICFLLYHELLFPPEKERIKNPERFTMMFAPITRTFERSYEDVDYEHCLKPIPQYVRNHVVLPNSLEENLAYLFAWKKVFSGDSFVYDYPLGRAHYGDLGYMAIARTIWKDIRQLEKLGLNGYISCQELRASYPHNLPNYVMARMLWDNTGNYDELVQEYCEAAYGSSWRDVVSYLQDLSTFSSCDYFNAIGKRHNPELSQRYAVAKHVAQEFVDYLRKGLSQSAQCHDSVQLHQWEILDAHRRYVIAISQALCHLAGGEEKLAQRDWEETLDYIRSHEFEALAEFDVYRVIEVAKNYAGFALMDECK
ncbi:DUF4838 domain-containing protein [Alloscardovia venturai]|uniref:DUF4838 domain-containing protein n=1 Tax=Alloscardovia venturai TaxID=1769421 RepID=A0ABW2Y9Y1_9BIFI